MLKHHMLGTVRSALFGLGMVSFALPFVVYLFMNVESANYIWIISGPYPFSNLGSAPYFLSISSFLIVLGLCLIAAGHKANQLLKHD